MNSVHLLWHPSRCHCLLGHLGVISNTCVCPPIVQMSVEILKKKKRVSDANPWHLHRHWQMQSLGGTVALGQRSRERRRGRGTRERASSHMLWAAVENLSPVPDIEVHSTVGEGLFFFLRATLQSVHIMSVVEFHRHC